MSSKKTSNSRNGGGKNKRAEKSMQSVSKGGSSRAGRDEFSSSPGSHRSGNTRTGNNRSLSYAEMDRQMKKLKRDLDETNRRAAKVEEKLAAKISRYFDLKSKKLSSSSKHEEYQYTEQMEAIFREICPALL